MFACRDGPDPVGVRLKVWYHSLHLVAHDMPVSFHEALAQLRVKRQRVAHVCTYIYHTPSITPLGLVMGPN